MNHHSTSAPNLVVEAVVQVVSNIGQVVVVVVVVVIVVGVEVQQQQDNIVLI